MLNLTSILMFAMLLTSCATPESKYFKYADSSTSESVDDTSLDNQKKAEQPYFQNLRKQIDLVWEYPIEASKAGKTGTSEFKFKILEDGSVQDVICLKTSGHFILDESTAKAITEAAPFGPIPASFNKNHLWITGKFNYKLTPPEQSIDKILTPEMQEKMLKLFEEEEKTPLDR